MPISVSCPTCDHSMKAPEQLVGKRIKCSRCNNLFTVALPAVGGGVTTSLPGRSPGAAVASPVEPGNRLAIRAAFWLGLASVVLGLTAGVFGAFRATVGYSHVMVWLGILMGSSSVVLAIFREECGFTFPFSGATISFLSLALLSFWLTVPARRGPGMGPGGGPGQGGGRGGQQQGVDKGQAPDAKGEQPGNNGGGRRNRQGGGGPGGGGAPPKQ